MRYFKATRNGHFHCKFVTLNTPMYESTQNYYKKHGYDVTEITEEEYKAVGD